MAKREKKPSKKTAVKPAVGSRTRKLTKKQQKAKARKEVQNRKPIPGSFRLTADVFRTLRRFWRPLGGVVLVYAILTLILASGLISSISATAHNTKSNLQPSQHTDKFTKTLSGFGSILTGGGGASASAAVLTFLLIFESLVIIWALRQLLAGERISVKQAYYSSMFPLVPFLLVLIVLVIQLLPLTVGTAAVSLVLSSVILNNAVLSAVLGVISVLLAAWTLYMLSGSVFAAYIVTLPDMLPRRALRSAKSLVKYRRAPIIRRLIFLPIFILVIMAIIIIPLIWVADFLVAPLFFILVMLAILYAHTYLYSLYRSLIE